MRHERGPRAREKGGVEARGLHRERSNPADAPPQPYLGRHKKGGSPKAPAEDGVVRDDSEPLDVDVSVPDLAVALKLEGHDA